ncbi:unnamed protein product [Hyaloperonospora brassicae]|uniref:Uncharacterized protein n=1 Tax=Hyaloperonospora brassicae TaxID=162125 RepID=A0AAV0T8A2_HYABA|nr:unnamed protein product [Hyaloperonospora brassicae]
METRAHSTRPEASHATQAKHKTGERHAPRGCSKTEAAIEAAKGFCWRGTYGHWKTAARADPLKSLPAAPTCSSPRATIGSRSTGRLNAIREDRGAALTSTSDVDAGRVAMLISRYERVTADNGLTVASARRSFPQSLWGPSSSWKATEKREHVAARVKKMNAVELKREQGRQKTPPPPYLRVLQDTRAKRTTRERELRREAHQSATGASTATRMSTLTDDGVGMSAASRMSLRPDVMLENALAILRRMDLDAIPKASAILAGKTLKSADSCARCLNVPAAALIYNVIVRMSTRVADLVTVQNLLVTLSNLAKFRLSMPQVQLNDRHARATCVRSEARSTLDMQLVGLLGEVLLVFSGELKPNQAPSWRVFTAAASALWDTLLLLQAAVQPNMRVGPFWSQTTQRLYYLRHYLSHKRTQYAQQHHLQQQHEQHLIPNRNIRGTATARRSRPPLEQYLTQTEAVLDRIIHLIRR